MAWLVQRSVKARGLVLVLVIVVLVMGAVHLRVMPRDVLPEFQPPTVEVQTEALGLSAAEVEQLITVPLEQDLLNGVAYLDVIRSRSVTGLSSIELVFRAGTDLSRARLLVNERLTQARALPNVSKPPQMLQPLSSASRVMMISLSSKHLSLIDLSVLARWTIRPRLMGVPGVASVAVWGQRDRQLQVLVEPEQLQSKGVTLDQVIRTTGNAMFVSPLSFLEASTPGTGGFIDGPNQRLGVQHNLPIRTPQDLAKVVVEGTGVAPAAAPDGGPAPPPAKPALRLGDVAQVVEDHQPLIGDASSSDGESLMLVVEKFPQANAVEVTGHIDEALQALAPGLAGVKMDSSIYRPATYVEKSTRNLAIALILGLLLMVLVVGTFLFDWRAAVVSLISVGVSLVAALLILQLGGATANAMSLAGLALGLMVVVDSVIVDIEHILGRLRQRRAADNGQSLTGVVVDASLRMRRPLMFASLVIVVTLAPLFTLKGEPGAFFPAVAIAYATAVVVSVVAALTLTPVACRLLGPGRLAGRDEAPAVRLVHRAHDRLFARATGRVVLAAVGVIVLLGVATLPFLTRGSSMIPTFKDTGLLVHVDGPPGTSLTEMNRITARLSAELRSLRGVRNVGGHIGRAVMSDQVVTASSSELWVTIDPGGYDSTVASIRSVVKGYPGLSSSLSSYPSDRVNEVLPKQKDITVRIFGPDRAILQTKANEVTQAVSQIKGIVNAKVDVQPVEPSIEVEVDLAAAQRYGVKPGDVRRAAAVVLSGIEVGSLFEQQKVFDVVVWGTPRARASLSNVQNVLIDTPSGDRVRVGDVATVRVAPSPIAIRHQSVSRYIDVVADVHGRDTGAVASDIKARLAATTFPLEYHADLLGNYARGRAAHLQFLALAVAATIGVILLLQAAFGSWRLALVASLVLPLSLVGGLVGAAVDGGVISLGSLIGLWAVFGISVHHLIVLLSQVDPPGQQPDPRSRRQLVADASRQRATPIVVTTLGLAVAVLPIVFAGTQAGLELVQPMAVVLLGGLVTSAVVSLLIAPALYLRLDRDRGEGGVPSSAPDVIEHQRAEQRSPVGAP